MKSAFCRLTGAASLVLALSTFANSAQATETENQSIRVLPKPGPVVVDGRSNDWDLSGGVFACGELEHLRDHASLWIHTMYDADNFYVLARWKDDTPLNNPEALGGHGFNGDCLQLRFILFPDTDKKTITWWDAWQDSQGRSVIGRASPGPGNGAPDNVMPDLANTSGDGAQQAFTIDADGKGYTQELSIPWKMMSPAGIVPAVGESFRFTVEPNFTAGAYGRITIKDIFNEQSKAPDRIFTFAAFKDWGKATIAPQGKVAPQPVRLADARTFPVSMDNGAPKVDWTGLLKRFEWPGFKEIKFDMPFAGYTSLNIVDDKGKIVRHLLNQDQRDAGPVTVKWDGLTDATYRTPGQPVPAGNYSWKAIAHPGATLNFRGYASYSGKAPWQASSSDFWLGDHGVPSAAVTDGERMYLACNGAEGGRHLIATDFNGNLIWGLQNTTGASDPEVIAVSGGVVYVVHPKVDGFKFDALISRVNAKTGVYEPWTGRKNHILTSADVFGADSTTKMVGLDAHDGVLYGTTGDSLVLLDAGSGALRKTWPLAGAAAIKVRDANTAFVVCGNEIRQVDPTTGTSKVFLKDLTNPRSLTVDAQGRVLVSFGAPVHQVVAYSAAGKELGRVGTAGGRGLGPWQADRMLLPTGLALDPQGKLWVMEHDYTPKRVSVWDMKQLGKPAASPMVKEFFGPTHYGASGGAINPRDPDIMVGEGCEWRIDPKGGPAKCLGTFSRSIDSFATYREGSNGRLYLFINAMSYGTGTIQVWERLSDARYVKRVELNNDVKDADKQLGATTLWTDENGDGVQQPAEVQDRTGALYASGSNSWSLNLGPDMTLYAYDKLDSSLKSLNINGFTANGAPRYDLTKLKTLPAAMSKGYQNNYSCAFPSADNKSLLVNLSVPENPAGFLWHCFDMATGELKWTYPNPYFQVHGSHKAPAPDLGLFRGAYGPVGTATLPGVGDFWVINGNLGEWWALSSDGFYLSRIFNGNVFDWKWPALPIPGTDFTDLPSGSGGEDFGGSVTQAKDGKVYIQSGKAGLWNLSLDGLEKTVNIPGTALNISQADTVKAKELREASLQAALGGSKLAVRKGTITLTGNFDQDFGASERIEYKKTDEASVRSALSWDDENLYVGWQVKDASPWINGATDISQMYAAGDTVDLQLGSDPNADPKRRNAVKGDLRLSIGNYQGKPTAVLYRFVSDEKKPRTFSSGVVQGYKVDYVDVLDAAEIKVSTDANGYVVETAIPLEALGLKAGAKMTLRGDVGVTHADAANGRTRLRTYWSNQETGLVDDVVFELQINPANWGEFSFE